MKYKVGDEVFIKAKIDRVDSESSLPYLIKLGSMGRIWTEEKELLDCKTYADGLNDAWELAKKIQLQPNDGGLSNNDLFEVFGTAFIDTIFKNNTYAEALAKIEAYEKEKEIKVGDVVEHNGFKGVVVHILPDGELNIVYENGLFGASCSEREYAKTGKHLEIADLLRQIGE